MDLGFFLCLYNELHIKLWWDSAIMQQTTLSQPALSMALTLFKGSGHLEIPKRSVSDGHRLWQGCSALALIARKSEWQGTNLQLSWYLKCFGWPKPHFIGLYIMQSYNSIIIELYSIILHRIYTDSYFVIWIYGLQAKQSLWQGSGQNINFTCHGENHLGGKSSEGLYQISLQKACMYFSDFPTLTCTL